MEYLKEIEEIMENMECAKDFKCYRSGFKDLCEPKGTVTDSYIECGGNCPSEPHLCEFRVLFGHSSLCSCPLRNFIYRRLRK
ncbi:MAG: hypothetical protein ACOC6M_00390 [Halobacteriota archaeon]